MLENGRIAISGETALVTVTSVETPINNSKGCGGVMRVAPIGLYFNDRKKDIRDICRFGRKQPR